MHRFCLLTVIFFCILPGVRAQSVGTLFMDAAIRKLDHAKEYTLQVALLMPAEYYGFRPSPEEMSFAQQLLHLSNNAGWLSSSYLHGQKNPMDKSEMKLQNKDSIITVVSRIYDYALEVLKTFPAGHLADSVSFFARPMNKLEIINLINDHQTHHRAQLVVYLRLKGIKPPNYVGW